MLKKLFVLFIIFGIIFIVGCSSNEGDIKSQEEVTETVSSVSEDLDNISGTLDSLGEDLG